VISRKPAAAILLLITLAAAGLPTAWGVGDQAIHRPLQFSRGPSRPAGEIEFHLSPEGRPSDARLRPFPPRLRAEGLPAEPDGVLWRRIRERDPGIDPLRMAQETPLRLAAGMETYRSGADPDTVHCLIIRVDFLEDSAGSESSTLDGGFDLRPADSARVAVDSPPRNKSYFNAHMESLSRYYHDQSGGQLVVEWEIYPTAEDSAYHLSDVADYGPWYMEHQDVDLLALAERFVRDSYATADSSDDPPDFRKYDTFLLFHSGADYQGDINRDSPYDIPSFTLELAEPVAVQDSTTFFNLILVVPETQSQDGFLGALNGVLAHEFGHLMGFYDLYNVINFFPQVGMFSLHDSGDGLYGSVWDPYQELEVFVRGAIPASIDPWHRMIFFPDGTPTTWIKRDSVITLPAVELENEIALVPIGGQLVEESEDDAHLFASEYYILENRQYDLNGDGTVYLKSDSTSGVILGPMNIPADVTDSLGMAPDTLGRHEQDYLLPGEGILIWHIDNAALAQNFSYCYACVNVLPGRRSVDVEEADGIEDLGDIYSVEWTGGQYDYWFKGGYSHFGPETDPSTASSGGAITGITIDVRDSSAVEMEIGIEVGRTRPGWPIYAGAPIGPEAICAADLDGDGIAEVASAAGPYAQLLAADGSTEFLAVTDSVLLPGVAASDGLVKANGQRTTLVAAASEVRLYGWDVRGREQLRYPGGEEVFPDLRFTTPPMVLDSVVVIGANDGRIRGLRPGAEPVMIWRTPEAGYAVTALAAGEIVPGVTSLVWGDDVGEVRAASGSQVDGFIAAEGWPRTLGAGGDAIDWLLLIAPGSRDPLGRVLAVGAEGVLGLWWANGSTVSGWPLDLGDAPAGPPVVGDPDGDGQLEIVITTREGMVHMLDLEGREEPYWPVSVWHPDAWRFGSARSGPVLADIHPVPGGDGWPEVLQGSADGTLHAFNAMGEETEGWPWLVGYSVAAGPVVAPLADEAGLQITAADALGFITVLKAGLSSREMQPGEMWSSRTGMGADHFYAADWLTEPAEWSGLLDLETLHFTPNPARGTQAYLRTRMGVEGRLRVQLYDTSGHRVWEGDFQPDAGAQGDVLELNLADVAPGLYVARITATGAGEELNVQRKLALVR